MTSPALTRQQIEILRDAFDSHLAINEQSFHALCTMALSALSEPKGQMVPTPEEIRILIWSNKVAADGAMQQDDFNGERQYRQRMERWESLLAASSPTPRGTK